MNACIEEICSKSTQERQYCLPPTDRCIQCSRGLVCWSQLSHLYYQAGSVKIRRTLRTLRHLGLADWWQTCGQVRMLQWGIHTSLAAARSVTVTTSGLRVCISDVCGLTASSSVYAEYGEFLGTLLVGARPTMVVLSSWEVNVKGREQHNRTWLIVHWAVDSRWLPSPRVGLLGGQRGISAFCHCNDGRLVSACIGCSIGDTRYHPIRLVSARFRCRFRCRVPVSVWAYSLAFGYENLFDVNLTLIMLVCFRHRSQFNWYVTRCWEIYETVIIFEFLQMFSSLHFITLVLVLISCDKLLNSRVYCLYNKILMLVMC